MADIIQAIDGPLTVTACSTQDEACEQFEKCNVRDPLWRIKDRILAALVDLLAGRDHDRNAATARRESRLVPPDSERRDSVNHEPGTPEA